MHVSKCQTGYLKNIPQGIWKTKFSLLFSSKVTQMSLGTPGVDTLASVVFAGAQAGFLNFALPLEMQEAPTFISQGLITGFIYILF